MCGIVGGLTLTILTKDHEEVIIDLMKKFFKDSQGDAEKRRL